MESSSNQFGNFSNLSAKEALSIKRGKFRSIVFNLNLLLTDKYQNKKRNIYWKFCRDYSKKIILRNIWRKL